MNIPAGFNGAAFETDHNVLCWVSEGQLVTNPPIDNLDELVAANAAKYGPMAVDQARQAAYALEADPLYFKWQRGEATEKEWLDKVAEIRARHPKPA